MRPINQSTDPKKKVRKYIPQTQLKKKTSVKISNYPFFFSFNEYGSSCLLINLHAGGAKLEIGRGGSSTSSWVWMTDSLSPYPPSPYHCFSYSGFTTITSLDLLLPFMEQSLSISLFAILLFLSGLCSFSSITSHYSWHSKLFLSLYISIIHIIASSSFQAFYHHFTLLPYLWYLSFFSHGQNFWRIKFTPKNANFSR